MRIKHGLLFIVYGAVSISGQTRVDLKNQSGNIDFSNAPSVRPFRGGTILPATCLTGEMFFKMDAPPGSNSYGCVALNTWALQGQGGSGAVGPQGATGLQGVKGDTGPVGPQGASSISTGTVTHTLGALTLSMPVIGNGGGDVAAGTSQGNTTRFVSYAGSAPAANDCAKFDANGNLTTNALACGAGGSGPTYNAGTGIIFSGTTISADTAALQDVASEQSNIHASVLAVGGPTAYVASGSTTYTAYTTRMLLTVQFGTACTGGVTTTINVDALGAKSLFKADGTTNLASTDCALNQIQEFVYNAGGAFQLIGGASAGGGTSVTAATPYFTVGGLSYIPSLATQAALPPTTGWTAANFTGATFTTTGLNGALTITTAGTRSGDFLQEQYRPMTGTKTLIAAVKGQGFLNGAGQGACGVGATLASTGASYLQFQEFTGNGIVTGRGAWASLTTQTFRDYRIIGSPVSYFKMVFTSGGTVVTTSASTDGVNWIQTDVRTPSVTYDSWVFYAQPTGDPSPYGAVNCTLLSWSVS